MAVTTDQVVKGICTFLDKELLSQFPAASPKKYMLGIGMDLFAEHYKNNLQLLQNNDYVKMFGVFTEDGMVDLDNIKKAAISRMPDSGVEIELHFTGVLSMLNGDFSKMTITKEDVEKIYQCIME